MRKIIILSLYTLSMLCLGFGAAAAIEGYSVLNWSMFNGGCAYLTAGVVMAINTRLAWGRL